MFSQNVIDARELMMESGENVWDSQQNSQAWSFSQNSNSQVAPVGNSSQNSFKYTNEMTGRPNRFSNNSDYWSQSQNVSQPLKESDDGRGYHLKYLNKPLLNIGKSSSNSSQMKSLSQNMELQRKKTFELDSSNKLDSILSAFTEFSREMNSSVGALKTEISAEIDELSKRLLTDTKNVTQGLEKLSGEMKDNAKLMTETVHKDLAVSSDLNQKMKSKLENLEVQMENIKAQVLKSEELNQQRSERIDAHSKQMENLLLDIVSCVRKNQSEQLVQNASDKIEKNCTKNSRTEVKLEESPTEDTTIVVQNLKGKCFGMSSSCAKNQTIEKSRQLSRITPCYEGSDCYEATDQSSMTNAQPVVHNAVIKKEPEYDEDDSLNIIRRTSKKLCQQEKNAEASSVFLFDLSSDVESSDGSSTAQTKKEKRLGPLKASCYQNEISCSKPNLKQFSNGTLKVFSNVNSSVQKSITSYGKIRKDSTRELAKAGISWRSPKISVTSKASPISRMCSPKLLFKEKMRVISRGSVAKKRKEYAESVFCFDDYEDMRKLQFQICHSRKKQWT